MQDPNAYIQKLVAGLPGDTRDVLGAVEHFRARGELDNALRLLRRAVERHPINEFRIELARINYEIGEPREAMSCLVSVLKLAPDHVDSLLLMAQCMAFTGEENRAHQMLDRAARVGARADLVESIRHEISGDPTTERSFDPNSPALQTSPRHTADVEADQEKPRRKRTAIGTPLSSDDRALPRIQTGEFVDLERYDTPDANEQSLLESVPAIGDDTQFDRLLSDMGLPVEPLKAQSQDEFETSQYREEPHAGPDDATSAIMLDDAAVADIEAGRLPSVPDEVADDATQAIVFDDEIQDPVTPIRQEQSKPQSKGGWQQADLGTFSLGVDISDEHEPRPVSSNEPGTPADKRHSGRRPSGSQNLQHQAQQRDANDAAIHEASPGQEAPARQSFFDEREFEADLSSGRSDARPHHESRAPRSEDPPQQPHHGGMPPSPSVDGPQGLSAKVQTSNSSKSDFGIDTRIVVAVVVGGLLLVTVFGALTLSSIVETRAIAERIEAADAAAGPDTYASLVATRDALAEAATHSGALGVRLPGSSAPDLQDRARARLAHVTALLQWRFGGFGIEDVRESLAMAPGDEPESAAARVYASLIQNDPHGAAETAEQAVETWPKNPPVIEAALVASLELSRLDAAKEYAASLQGATSSRVRAAFLVALLDKESKSDAAMTSMRKVIDASPDHTDAQIEMARLMNSSEEELEESKTDLNALLDRELPPLQRMRALQALAQTHMALEDKGAGEASLKEAVKLAPSMGKAYVPLIEFYMSERRFDELDALIEAANESEAVSPRIAYATAESLLRQSQPEKAVHLVGQWSFEDVEKEWWRGRGYLDLGRNQDALAAFRSGVGLAKSFHPVVAFESALVARVEPEKREESALALKNAREHHPDNPHVFEASALFEFDRANDSGQASSRKKRLDAAETHVKAALELVDDERLHFELCRAYVLLRSGEEAEAACEAGRNLNPNYVPGILVMAELRRLQGRSNEAVDLLEPLVDDRPDDQEVALSLARSVLQNGDVLRAQKIVDEWIGKGVAEEHFKLIEGLINYERKRYSRAAGYFKHASQAAPIEVESMVYYASTAIELGQSEEPDTILRDLLSHPTWGGTAWMELGKLRHKQSRWRDVEQNFSRARSEFKSNTGPKAQLSELAAAWALAYKDRWNWDHSRVSSMLEQGQDEGDPGNPELNYTLALYHLNKRRSDRDAGRRHLVKTVEEAPYRCDAQLLLAQLVDSSDSERVKELKTLRETYGCGDSG